MLNDAEKRAVASFRRRVRDELAGLSFRVVLYGSKARGDARPDSDIDVLVVHSGADWHFCDAIYGITTDILLETGIELSAKVLSEDDARLGLDSGSPFWRAVLSEGMPV